MLDQIPKALYQVCPQAYEDSKIKSKSQKTRQARKSRCLSKLRGRNYPQDQLLITKDPWFGGTTTKLLAC